MIKEINFNEYDIKYSYIINNLEIGFIITRKLHEVLDIIDFEVKKDYRNKGYGFKLLKHVIDNNKDIDKIMLEVKEDNKCAIHLYEKFGFIKISERKKYYKDKTAIIMEKKINKDIYIMGFETSCDETSVSIVKNGTEDIATAINTQIDIHKNYGGVVPEIASRMHLENITIVIDETLKKANMKLEDIDAFASTYGPGLIGSLLIGLECSKTLSLIYNKPFIKVNHMMGHIYAANIGRKLNFPLIALVISGGHTDIILMENENSFKYLGSTLDDAIGECFDKVARVLDISYPGGPNLENLAKEGKFSYEMPTILNDDTYNFSFSGIKSYVVNLVNKEKNRGNDINKKDLAFSFQECVTNLLVNKTKKALEDFNIKRLVVVGGVASNEYIRKKLCEMSKENNIEMIIPEKKYCTDNATMIASAAHILYINNEFSDLSTNPKSNATLK